MNSQGLRLLTQDLCKSKPVAFSSMNWGRVPEAPLLAEELVAVDSFQGRIFFFLRNGITVMFL